MTYMAILLGFMSQPTVTSLFGTHTHGYSRTKKRYRLVKAKLNNDDDPFFQAAVNAASLRFQETHRPEPLFVDAYAGCFVTPHDQMETKEAVHCHHYCLATKYIDDKLLRSVSKMDGLKQVVLLTDGMDTRPFRLKWPPSTIIYDISPGGVFNGSAEKLAAVGAKVPKSCLYFHIPLESSNIEQFLKSKGFMGSRPSVWSIQGLPVMTLAKFEEILYVVGSMAMKGCNFFGELPAWLAQTEIRSDISKWMEKIFMSNGFRVNMISYDEVARNLGQKLTVEDYSKILFIAEQLRFSDDQMETWRREFQRVEDEGDEEGFEEL